MRGQLPWNVLKSMMFSKNMLIQNVDLLFFARSLNGIFLLVNGTFLFVNFVDFCL